VEHFCNAQIQDKNLTLTGLHELGLICHNNARNYNFKKKGVEGGVQQ
jgi:hypothetical protein